MRLQPWDLQTLLIAEHDKDAFCRLSGVNVMITSAFCRWQQAPVESTNQFWCKSTIRHSAKAKIRHIWQRRF